MRTLGHVSFLCFTLSIFTSVYNAKLPTTELYKNAAAKHQLRVGTNQLAQDIDEWLNSVKNPTENTIYSSVSVYHILTAIYFGADRRTKKELERHFNFKNKYYGELDPKHYAAQLSEMTTSKALDAFNSYVFHKKNLIPKYVNTLKTLNFTSEHFRTFSGKEKVINDQVKSDTNGLITEMFSPGSFDDMTSLVLLNTILFTGKWDETRGEFKERDTKIKKQWFTGTKGNSKGPFNAEFMYSKDRHLKLYEDKTNKVLYISLKFKGDVGKPVWMTIAMPRRASKVPVHKVAFNATAWEKMENRKADLTMPRFEIESDNSLIDFMKHKGASRLFNAETAQLYRMFGRKSKDYIAKFSQKAIIKVHEKGAEAAAATGVQFVSKSMARKKKHYVIKRPFKFFIHSTKLDFVRKQTKERLSADLFFAGTVNCPMNKCN